MNHRQPMESRMRGNAHVRFGGRPEEPERPKARHRPSGPPNHIVALATDALDEIRREVWNEARRAGQTQLARDLKGARFALWKNPENLSARQHAKLADVQKTNRRLYRAYLLKEQLRRIYRLP